MTLARAYSGSIIGVEANEVIVESHRGKGLPGMTLIGLARGAVKESLVRVRSAILSSDYPLRSHRLVVNLLPAELPKEGSALDLALAVSLLAAGEVIDPGVLANRRFFGALSLGGRVEGVRGAVLVADLARRSGDCELIVPLCNAPEAAVIPGIRVVGVESLRAVVEHLTGASPLPSAQVPVSAPPARYGCMSEVRGQGHAKRAMEICAAGNHNILMVGPPGSGKSMLARRLAGLLPTLSTEECIEVTRIHSAAGTLPAGTLMTHRPFRAPHHTASDPALCGGGSIPKPGEISLAHRGVLFLDELPEFARRALETLRQPLEEGKIRICRAAWSLELPAHVLLVAAMNPCPCGAYRGDWANNQGSLGTTPCMCTFEQVQRYRSRISGPLLDRIDVHVLVDAVPYRELIGGEPSGESSTIVRERVIAARERQISRLGQGRTNAAMNPSELLQQVKLCNVCVHIIEKAAICYGFSARATGRILKVARTIADLEDSADVSPRHVREAIGYRVVDRSPLATTEDYETGGIG